MIPIPFSGMLCNPQDIQKEGDFKISGKIAFPKNDHPSITRYEYFASTQERDVRYNMILKLLKENQ